MPSPDFETVLPDSMLDELGAAARPSDFKPADAPEARAFLGGALGRSGGGGCSSVGAAASSCGPRRRIRGGRLVWGLIGLKASRWSCLDSGVQKSANQGKPSPSCPQGGLGASLQSQKESRFSVDSILAQPKNLVQIFIPEWILGSKCELRVALVLPGGRARRARLCSTCARLRARCARLCSTRARLRARRARLCSTRARFTLWGVLGEWSSPAPAP